MNRGYFLGPDQGNTLNLLTDCDRLCHVIHILYLDRIKQEQYSVPPYFYNHVEDVTCGYGHVATLHCDVTGQPEPRVSWFKQERNAPLRETPGKFALRKQCERVTLIIYDVTTEDIGCYTCKIWNELGEAQSTGRLFYSPSPDRTINDNGSCLKKVIIKETVKIVKREQDALSCHAVVAPGFNTQPQDGSRRDSITIHFPLLEGSRLKNLSVSTERSKDNKEKGRSGSNRWRGETESDAFTSTSSFDLGSTSPVSNNEDVFDQPSVTSSPSLDSFDQDLMKRVEWLERGRNSGSEYRRGSVPFHASIIQPRADSADTGIYSLQNGTMNGSHDCDVTEEKQDTITTETMTSPLPPTWSPSNINVGSGFIARSVRAQNQNLYFDGFFNGTNQAGPDDVITTQACPDDVIITQTQHNDVITTQAQTNDVITTQARPDDVIPTQTRPDDVIPTQSHPDDVITTQTRPDDVITTQAQTNDIITTQACPDDVITTQAQTNDVITTQACPDDVIISRPPHNNVTTTQACPDDVITTQACPDDVIITQVCPDDDIIPQPQHDDVITPLLSNNGIEIVNLRNSDVVAQSDSSVHVESCDLLDQSQSSKANPSMMSQCNVSSIEASTIDVVTSQCHDNKPSLTSQTQDNVTTVMSQVKCQDETINEEECSIVTSSQQEVTSLQQEVTLSQQKVTSSQQEVTSSQHEVTSSQQEVTSSQQEVTSSQQEVTSSQQEVTSSQQEVTSLQQEVTSLQQEVTSSQQEVTSSQQEVTSSDKVDLDDLIHELLDFSEATPVVVSSFIVGYHRNQKVTDIVTIVPDQCKNKTPVMRRSAAPPVGKKPEILTPLKDVHLHRGQVTSLNVSVTGQPEPKITWFKDGQPLDENAIEIDQSEPASGVYSCVATNNRGVATTSACVTIKHPMKRVQFGEELTRSYDEPMQDYLLYQEPPTQEPLDCSLVDYLRNKADSLPFHHRHRISFNESADSGDDSATFSEDNSLSHDYDITRRFSIVSFSSVSSAAYVTADEAGSETTLDYFSPNEDLISADDFFSPDSEHYLSQGDLRMKSLPPPSDDNLFCPRPLTPTLMMSSPNMMTSPFQITAFDTITNQSSSDEMLTADSGGETPVPQLDSDDDDVIKPLLFVSGVRDVSATIGTNVELSCTVECQPTPRVIWYKNNQKIPQTEKVANRFLTEIKRENKNQFKISLTVHDVKPDDGGEYMMAVTTAGGNLFSSGSLIIGSSLDSKPHAKYELMREIPSSVKYSSPQTGTPKVFPPSFDDITDDVECNIGDSATFRVTVLGNPPPVVSWYKDNVLLNEGEIERIDEGNQHSIIIHDVTHERSGIYSCTASSIAGHVTCKAELEAKLEPDWSKSDETSLQISKRRFKDNYKVDDIIGRGVISLVKRATHRVTNHTVAAKFIQNKHKDHITAQNEIDILTKCQHNHIVKFYESFTTSRHMIIVTEICKIELFEFFVTSQSFCEAMVSRYMKQLCEAISYLHRNNILHLNVKPENILLDENSTLKLINFGSAHRMNEDSVIYWNRGTPEFVAPEVVTSCQVTTGTDMWSVGVVTYLALTGVSPFAGETDQMTLFRIRDFDEKLNFKHFHQISESGKDFVSMLIVMSQSSRLSADDVINHEWMASSVEKKLETERLKYFQSRRKWQRSLLTGKSTLTIRSMTSLLHGEYGSTSLAVPRHVIDDVTSSTTVTESEDEEPPLVPRPNPTPTIQISSPLTSPAVERREIFKAGRSLSGSMERPLQLKEDRSKPPEGRRLDLLQVGKKQVSFEEKVDIVTSSDDNVFDDVIKEPQENNESKQHHLVGRSEPETKRKKKTNTRVVRHRSFDVPVSSSDEETSEVRGKEGVSHHVTPHKGKLGVPHASTEIRGKEGNPSPPRCSIKRRIWGRAASLDSEHGGIPKPRKGILKKGNSTDSETSGNQKFRPLKTGDEKYPDVGNYKRKVIRKVNTLPGSGAPPSSPLSSISSVTRRRQMMVRGLSVDSAIRPSMVKGGLRGPLFEQRHHNDDSDVTTAGAMMRGSPLQNRSFSPLRGNTPDPPIISRVVGADVWVRWSPSHCDSAQISYRLEMQSHGSSSWKIVAENIKSTSYHVIGLDRRLSYVFRVAATTSGQYGVFSQPSQNVSFMKKR